MVYPDSRSTRRLFEPMNYSIFLPVRGGSQRIPGKNTRRFASYEGGLVELKLRQLLALPDDFEIVLSTDDPEAVAIAARIEGGRRVRIDERPPHLCSSAVLLEEVIRYAPTVCHAQWIIWTHVTSPFFDERMLLAAVGAFEEARAEDFDSLMGVTRIQKYLWSGQDPRPINYERAQALWPSTQDLPVVYEVNSSIFIADRTSYAKAGDRIGRKPLLWETPKIGAIDVDWPEDFEMAEALNRIQHATIQTEIS